jgi:hypothetical protein
MNSATRELLTVSVTTTMIAIAIMAGFLSLTMPIQKSSAQMMGPGMMMRNQNFTGMMGPMMGPRMMAVAPNITGSVPMFPTIAKAISSQVHTSLVNATMTAEKTVGSNAHAISTHVGIENGFLVYTAWVIDSNNNMHRVIVDAGNGKVLSNQQIPMREAMMMMHMMMHGGGMMMMSPQSGMGMMGPMMGGFHP